MTNGTKTKKRLTKSQLTARREKTVAFIVLAIAAFLFIFPLIYMLGTSFKSDLDLQMHPEKIFPTPGQWTLKHYNGFFITHSGELDNMPKWMINSIWSTAAAVLLTLLTDLIVAYVVVFLRWKDGGSRRYRHRTRTYDIPDGQEHSRRQLASRHLRARVFLDDSTGDYGRIQRNIDAQLFQYHTG